MSDPLDRLLTSERVSSSAELRARVLASVHTAPDFTATPRPWRVDAARWLGLWAALIGIAAAAVLVTGATTAGALARHLPALTVLAGTGAAAAFAALAPRRTPFKAAAVALGLGAAAVIVLMRYPSMQGSALPPWVCTLNHVAVGLLPLIFGVRLLRQAAPTTLRSLALGVAAGTTGAVVGELACEQGFLHVAVFHLGAWVLVTLAMVVAGRWVRPRSYAP